MRIMYAGFFFLLLFALLSHPVFARTATSQDAGMRLTDALKLISEHYQANFLYEETSIRNKKVTFSAAALQGKKIDEVLTGMLVPVGLSWSKIDSKNYSIFPAAVKTKQEIEAVTEITGSRDTITGVLLPLANSKGQELKEVKIFSGQPVLQKIAERYVLNLEKSIISEGASLLDMMDKLPGVQVGQDGRLTIKGRAGITILVDGKTTALSTADLSGMLSSNIERIELINNPSAKYEAAGSAGVINIIRKKNKKDGINGNVTLGYGRGKYNRYNGSFNLGFKNAKYNLSVNTAAMDEKTYTNAYAVSEFFEGNNKTGTLDAYNHHVKKYRSFVPVVGLELYLSPKTTLTLSGSGQLQNSAKRSDSFTDVIDHNNIQSNHLGFLNYATEPGANYSAGTHITHQIDTAGRMFSADLDYSNYQYTSKQDITNTVTHLQESMISRSQLFLDQHNRLNIYAAKADFVQPLKNHGQLEIGTKSSYVGSKSNSDFFNLVNGLQSLDLTRSNYFKYDENINAGYINYTKNLQRFSYQAGLRVEQTNGKGSQLLTGQLFKQNYTRLFPSLSLKYKIDDLHSLSISSGRKIDRPAYLDLNPLLNFVNAAAYIQGDPNLKPQVTYNNELGYSYHNTLFVTLGNSFYTNYITYWVFPENGLNQSAQIVVSRPVNIQKAVSYNANVLWVKKVTAWWAMNSNLTLYYNLYTGTVNNYYINNQGRPALMASANNVITFTERISAEVNFRYSGKSQDGTSVYQSNSNLSLGLKTTLLKNRASLTFNVTDVFHDQNYIWTSNTGSIFESRNVRIDSRVAKINFSWKFGKAAAREINRKTAAEEEKNRVRNN